MATSAQPGNKYINPRATNISLCPPDQIEAPGSGHESGNEHSSCLRTFWVLVSSSLGPVAVVSVLFVATLPLQRRQPTRPQTKLEFFV